MKMKHWLLMRMTRWKCLLLQFFDSLRFSLRTALAVQSTARQND